MLEKDIEQWLNKKVESLGGLSFKFVSPNNPGVPDRIYILPKGKVFFVELKTEIGRMSNIQKWQRERLRKIGCRKAVEKQKPKKPIKAEKSRIRYTEGYICPRCGGGFSGTGIAGYCYHCGQHIDWSEEKNDGEINMGRRRRNSIISESKSVSGRCCVHDN